MIKLKEMSTSNLFQILCSFCIIPFFFFFKGLESEQERKGIGKEKKNEDVVDRYLGHSVHSILISNSRNDGQEKTRNGYCKPETLFIEIKGKKKSGKSKILKVV